jgi:hypothetical protein
VRITVSMLVGVLIGITPIESGRAADEAPTFHYWHVWTDDQGITHQTVCVLHDYILKSMNPPAAPQWQDRLPGEGATVISTVLPVAWQGPWHENPRPQWIIPLSGRWFVETTDGKRIEMGPGDVSLGEDQGSKPDARGRKGHLSGSVGSEPTVLMVVQLKDPPKNNSPCHFQ